MNDTIDPFYDVDYTDTEPTLEEISAMPVSEEDLLPFEEEREDWQMTEEEEEIFNQLLRKKENEDTIMKTYKALEDRPSEEQLEDWKRLYGDIFLVSLSERENFVFRALKRSEWRTIFKRIEKLSEQKKAEYIVSQGVLFPKLTDNNMSAVTAGAPETIRNLILEASNFIDPERAITLVRKL